MDERKKTNDEVRYLKLKSTFLAFHKKNCIKKIDLYSIELRSLKKTIVHNGVYVREKKILIAIVSLFSVCAMSH
jgi:hypothetical protein